MGLVALLIGCWIRPKDGEELPLDTATEDEGEDSDADMATDDDGDGYRENDGDCVD